MGELEPTALDIASLVMVTGEAARSTVLARLADAGFGDIRPAHGYIFQRLIDGTPTITEIARELGITQQGASKLVVELEKFGYVRRLRHESDSRARRVALTARGIECLETTRAARHDLDVALAAEIGERTVRDLAAGLAAFSQVLGLDKAIRGRTVALPDSES